MAQLTLQAAQSVFTENIAKLIMYAYLKGWQLTFDEAYRTPEQQHIYYAKKLSKTLNSYHLKRLAVDFNLFVDGVLKDDGIEHLQLGKFWESLNELNRAGVNWGWDAGHFEMAFKN